MARVVVLNWVSLDGVMQGPGRAGEDTRSGFAHSGWAAPYSDDTIGAKMGELMSQRHAWLFGRVTYEGLLASWNEQGGPFKDALNDTTKYVASHDAEARLSWPNSVLLEGEVPTAIERLKRDTEPNLVIMGSGVLIKTLIAADLIDDYLLMIAPIVLGSGRKLFTDGTQTSLRLRECTPTSTGAVVARYERARGEVSTPR